MKHNSNYIGSKWFIILSVLCFAYGSCNQGTLEDSPTLFEYVDSAYSKIDFVNQVNESETRSIGVFDYFYNGGGVACGDFDNDGLTDIIFTGNDASNKIYQNKGNLQFEDRTEGAGIENHSWSTGVSLVDINLDGLLDIYICNSGPYQDPELTKNQLLINKGDFVFENQAEQYGIDDNSRSIQAEFFDMDNDGDLDLWVVNHSLRSHGRSVEAWFNNRAKLPKSELLRECNTLYENVGGKYIDISMSAGIQRPGFGLGISIHDFNEDGLLDVFVANDYFIPDNLYINTGNKTFVDQIKDHFNHVSYYSMGSDLADINNDGLDDLVVADMTPGDHVRNKTLMASMNTTRFSVLTEYLKYIPQYMFNGMYLNHGAGKMSDIAHYSGVSSTDWSWAPLLADFDNDGYKDLYVTNGFYRDTRNNDWLNELKDVQQSLGAAYTLKDYFEQLKKADQIPISNMIFRNSDGLKFEETTKEWNITKESFSNGAAYADFDNDGDLDLVVNNLSESAYLIKNNADKLDNNYIQVELNSSDKKHRLLNASICAYTSDNKRCVNYNFTRGYQSHMQELAHIGLGKDNHVDSLVIKNVTGQKHIIINPAINQKHILTDIQFASAQTQILNSTSFADVSNILLARDITHNENHYNEFEKEILLPHSQSRLGPTISTADINGDNLEDFFLGGAKGQAPKIFIQSSNGSFAETQSFNQMDSQYEDVGSLFLDVDNDGDLDLYVASGGGAEFEKTPKLLQDRLYLNDGQGNMSLAPSRLPKISSSTKCIVAADWDEDGDLDLFVGGRTSPGQYPISPSSYFLDNENGSYKDKSDILDDVNDFLGMITSATAIDVDGDAKKELVIVGEWMKITILVYSNGRFSEYEQESLNDTNGWWQSITAFDYDGDGDQDLFAGNIGLNNKFHPSAEKPLHIYANDFDETGTLDIVLSKYYNETLVPVRGKECSTEQMPFISEKYETYDAFANANLIDILGEEKIENSTHHEAKMFESILLINNDGQFSIEKLPAPAQLFPIKDAVIKDFNNDSKLDILIGGNLFDTEVETTQYDAGRGLLLMNNYPLALTTEINSNITGLNLSHNLRCIESIALTNRKIPGFLIGNNNGPIQLLLHSEE